MFGRKILTCKEILTTYGMTEYDEFELLKRSGAKLPTDNCEFAYAIPYNLHCYFLNNF